MQQNQRIIFYILILIAGASWILLNTENKIIATPTDSSAPQAGFKAPAFKLNTPDGTSYSLSGLKGKPVLVNLWATWCPPCRAEMPTIERMYLEYKEKGFDVLAINMTYQDDPLAVVPFSKEFGLTFPILLEETGDTAAAYQLRSLPSSYFIDRDGVISTVIIGGPMSEALLRTNIEQILK